MKLTDRPVRSIVRAIAGRRRALERRGFSAARSPARCRRRANGLFAAGRRVRARPHLLFAGRARDRSDDRVASSAPLDALDRFVERGSLPRARALPLGRVCIVSSRTTIGVAIVPAIFALCAKCDVARQRSRRRARRRVFCDACRRARRVREAARAQAWDGARDRCAISAQFDAVVAFGDDATLAQHSHAVSPAARFVPYGSKASGGYVGRDALAMRRTPARSRAVPRAISCSTKAKAASRCTRSSSNAEAR